MHGERDPHRRLRALHDAAAAKAYLRKEGAPIVVKADGLAAGKGVVVATSVAEAEAAVDMMLAGDFGDAGAEVVIGSVPARRGGVVLRAVRRRDAIPLASAQDHKRVFDGDQGPNTGGMGAYSPAPVMTTARRGA